MILSKSALAAGFAAACAVAAVPAGAQTPSPAFTAFTTVCGEPAADFAAVRQAADAHGWSASDAKFDPNMPGVTVAEQLTRASKADRVNLVMSAWDGTKGAVKISDCTVHVGKSDFPALRDATAAWLGFPAQDSTPKKVIYRFTSADGAHKALTSAEYDAAASASGLEILTVSGDQNGAVLDLMMIKK